MTASDVLSLQLLGYAAGTLTTIAFIPQALRVWRRRSAADLSLSGILVFTAGITCWLVYGLLLGAAPIAIANGVTLVLELSILACKLRYG